MAFRKLVLYVSLGLWSGWALGFDSINFQSKFARFTLEKSGSKYLLNGKSVNIGTFSEFLPILQRQLFDECGDFIKQKPDLKVILRNKDKTGIAKDTLTVRSFYIDKATITDGKKCLEARGSGIYYVPLHPSWFDKDAKDSIRLHDMVLKRNGKIIGSFKKDENDWVDAVDDQFINWDFFERFAKSLESFPIDLRMHESGKEGKPSFELITGGQTYNFYKVDRNLWAMQSPKLGWMLVSKSWAFWDDMDEAIWNDRFEDRLRLILDQTKDVKEREETLRGISANWNASIKHSLHKIILDPREEQIMKDLAL
ncbi:MAG: hypothetical protein KDD22_08490, partial [Bdellovibrionales bacterium]|nr:hypothetical protein [Bdellovibrionales bacterium]